MDTPTQYKVYIGQYCSPARPNVEPEYWVLIVKKTPRDFEGISHATGDVFRVRDGFRLEHKKDDGYNASGLYRGAALVGYLETTHLDEAAALLESEISYRDNHYRWDRKDWVETALSVLQNQEYFTLRGGPFTTAVLEKMMEKPCLLYPTQAVNKIIVVMIASSVARRSLCLASQRSSPANSPVVVMPSKRKRSLKVPEASHLAAAEPTIASSDPVPLMEDPIAAATAAVLALSEPLPGLAGSAVSPRRRASARSATKKKVKYAEATTDGEGEPTNSAAGDGNEGQLTALDDESAEAKPKVKHTRRKKDTEPVVYDIPAVERKQTGFTGRLGYACLNTILRVRKPEPVFCSRTCRLDTIRKNGIEFAKDLGRRNATDLLEMIEWNEENKIRFFRVSSEMFPFASHKVHGYDLSYAHEELKAAGALAKHYGHRLTAHPGQFTQLASPREDVVEASVRELDYHCQMMRYMDLDQDSVIIIHMGGVYGDKDGALARFRENYTTKLTDEMKARLVLENDEICYNPDELLPICEELSIPMVLDYHHNWINPSVLPFPELLPRIAATWTRKGIRQKQHLSEPRPGAESIMEKRAHADRCQELPEVLVGGDVDLMIEAKDKEQAVFHLYRIYGLEPVIHANLRPENPPKPFIRGKGCVAAEDDEGDGEDAAEEVNEDDARETRAKTRGKRTKTNVTQEGVDELTPNAIGESGEAASTIRTPTSSPMKRTPKRRRTATNVIASQAEIEVAADPMSLKRKSRSKLDPASSPKKRRTVSKLMTKTRELINQEEDVQPVDGARAEDVEADEHPEAVMAEETETITDAIGACASGRARAVLGSVMS
ncbi:hypothetical protein POSPLADRAFT_1050471 [Postia placenta MAD-698-R-SB12]|uniref:UV-endonuclease UvdE n=1 Tax=Postia placenta MAD-698-R-SB12 TaxID=670580 RepID=A0A1X6MKJ3_9APHY|nr:hypothetical protein POSPLADRAFT_1050471 [Postia placenta MAD-698-R-SB12]OSX56809.1 hypothetical protein POSPLADRAFT_1050471 [Postia placenta MAD-698-R-SB12]